jgi:hypothetical protein
VQHPEDFAEWHKSNYLVFLSVADEPELWLLLGRLISRGCAATGFREPDLGNALTAICVGPHPEVRKATSGLPLLLKNVPVAPIGQSSCALTQRVAGSSPARDTTPHTP